MASCPRKQLDSANDMVERAWSLIAGAMSGNPHRPTANTEWMDAAHAWEHDYCMSQGTLAAADREAPDEAGRICCRGMGADGGCNICAAEATR